MITITDNQYRVMAMICPYRVLGADGNTGLRIHQGDKLVIDEVGAYVTFGNRRDPEDPLLTGWSINRQGLGFCALQMARQEHDLGYACIPEPSSQTLQRPCHYITRCQAQAEGKPIPRVPEYRVLKQAVKPEELP